jgi:hypothetical protein
MKMIPRTVAFLLFAGAVFPVVAGPDWQTIHAGRQAAVSRQAMPSSGLPDSLRLALNRNCATIAAVRPVSHGPRAQVSAWQNAATAKREQTACRRADSTVAQP